jgi:primosomal protein N'
VGDPRLLAAVVVDLAVWGLNKELTYLVPPELAGRIRVGSMVRVPLRSRRVRGWVVGVSEVEETPQGLVSIAAISGRGRVFDSKLLRMAESLARSYVQPLSSFLALFTPPRVGRPVQTWPEPDWEPAEGTKKLVRLGPGDDPVDRYAESIARELEVGRGALIAVPEVREGSRVLERLAQLFPGEAALVHSGLEPAARSKALWAVAEGRKKLVLGGRAALFAPPFNVGTIVLHQEHDPSFKHQQAPYYDARRVAAERASVTGANLLFASATPSLDPAYWSGEWEVGEPDRSTERAAWPRVEVVEPTRRGLPQRVVATLIEGSRSRRRTLILLPRTEPTPSGPGPEELMALVARVVPAARITRADRPGLGEQPGALGEALKGDVVVATEAALAEVQRPSVGAAIALGVDAYLRRPRGRAAEDAFATLWALAGLAAGLDPKGRVILETRSPEHHAIQAVVRGDYHFFARKELEVRREANVPPFKSLVRVQTPVPVSSELIDALRSLPGTVVLGPAPGGSLGGQLLLRVDDLETILGPLGTMVAESPQRALVEVDPKDW